MTTATSTVVRDGAGWRLLRTVGPWAAGLLMLAPVALSARHLSLSMVQEIRFEGTVRANASQLRHLVDVPSGTATWQLDLDEVERAAVAHPWVVRAKARRVGLDTLVVEIEEHRPVLLLARGDLTYVDDAGRVFLQARGSDVDFPILTGVDPLLGEQHPELPRLVVRDAVALLEQLDASELLSPYRVSEVNFSRTRGFTVLLESGPRIVFGLQDLDVRLGRLQQLLADGLLLSTPSFIDLAAPQAALIRPLQG